MTGARVLTATASQGLALMHEMLYIASGLRCPIVMGVANRALSAPINIHGDHSDMMGSRDSGWVQIYAENAQEAYDWTIMAFKIAEDKDIQLPVAVNLDGFIISHCMEGVDVLEDHAVEKFLQTRKTLFTLKESPKTFNVIYGLGGRDIQSSEIELVFNEALETAKTGVVKEKTIFLGVRE